MIELIGVEKTFLESNGNRRSIFSGLSWVVPPDVSSCAIMGRSGSGKTTLLRILCGLDIDYRGAYRLAGIELPRSRRAMARIRRERMGIVAQTYNLLSDRNVADNVALGAYGNISRRFVSDCLCRVGLEGCERKRISELSGGERQRVALARALIKSPQVILADEPTGALDEKTEQVIMQLLTSVVAQNGLLIVATHNRAVADWCDRTYRIECGRLLDA